MALLAVARQARCCGCKPSPSGSPGCGCTTPRTTCSPSRRRCWTRWTSGAATALPRCAQPQTTIPCLRLALVLSERMVPSIWAAIRILAVPESPPCFRLPKPTTNSFSPRANWLCALAEGEPGGGANLRQEAPRGLLALPRLRRDPHGQACWAERRHADGDTHRTSALSPTPNRGLLTGVAWPISNHPQLAIPLMPRLCCHCSVLRLRCFQSQIY